MTLPSVLSGAFKKPFPEQVAFFRGKLGKLVPTKRWDDIKKSAHDTAFMVAGAEKADLLADLAAAVERNHAEGVGIEAFRKDFRAIVQKHGWHDYTGASTPAGRKWRTRVIYQTNMATAYAGARVAQLRERGFKYWIYRHNDSVSHPRPLHQAWNGITLPADDPWWQTHGTPNGWGCRCYILGARSAKGAKRLGGKPDKNLNPDWNKIDPKTGAPVGIDKDWDYLPGDTVSDTVSALAKKTATLPPEIGAAYGAQIADGIVFAYEAWIQGVLQDQVSRGKASVLGIMGENELAYLKRAGDAPIRTDISLQDRLVVGRKARRHQDAGNALSESEWKGLAASMRKNRVVLFDNDTGHLLYILPSESYKKIKIVVEPNYWDKKASETINSSRAVFKIGITALTDRRRYTVIEGVLK